MSADNYYRICKHPKGGYAAVMGFASNDEYAEPTENHRQFDTIDAAFEHAYRDPIIEYGIRVDRELL